MPAGHAMGPAARTLHGAGSPEGWCRGCRTGCTQLSKQGSLCKPSCSMVSSASLMTSTACVSVSMSAGQHMTSEFGLQPPASGWSEPFQSPPEVQCVPLQQLSMPQAGGA